MSERCGAGCWAMKSTCMPSSTPRSTVSLSSRERRSRYGLTTVGRSRRLATASWRRPGPRRSRPVASSVQTKPSSSSAYRIRCTVVRGSPARATSSLNVSPPDESAASSLRIVAALASTCTPLRCSCSLPCTGSITVPPSTSPLDRQASAAMSSTDCSARLGYRPGRACGSRALRLRRLFQSEPAPHREQVDVPALGDETPDAARSLGRHDDGDHPKEQHVGRTVLAEALQQSEVDHRADDGALDRPEPTDDDDEQRIRRPVDAERRGRLDAQEIHGDDGADDAAAERGDEVDVELRTEDVDTGALRRQLVVADGREGEAEPRAQQEVDEQDRAHGNEQREQVRTSDARIDRQASGGDDGLAGPAARGLD